MSITSISAYSGGFNYYTSPFAPQPSNSRSVTQLANGATVTTLRGSTGDVVSVTTAITAVPAPVAQSTSSTVDVTA